MGSLAAEWPTDPEKSRPYLQVSKADNTLFPPHRLFHIITHKATPMLFGIARNPAALGSGAMPRAEGNDPVRKQGAFSRLLLQLLKNSLVSVSLQLMSWASVVLMSLKGNFL